MKRITKTIFLFTITSLSFIGLIAAPKISAAEIIKLEGNKTISGYKNDGVRYVIFTELLTVLDLDQEYSDKTGKYTILSSDRRNGVSISFAIGNRKIAINKEEVFIPYPPILKNQQILLPLDIFLTALGVIRVVPTGQNSSKLTEVTFSPFIDFTRLQFLFSAPVEAVAQNEGNNQISITFKKAGLGKESSRIPVNSSHVKEIIFSETEGDSAELTGSIITDCETDIELFSLENGRRTIIDIIEKNARNNDSSSIHHNRNFIATCKVVIDPGHGGTDLGCTFASGTKEKDVTLKTASYIVELMRKDGLDASLSRTADISIPLLSRLNAINAVSPDVVISIHLSTKEMKKIGSDTIVNILALKNTTPDQNSNQTKKPFSNNRSGSNYGQTSNNQQSKYGDGIFSPAADEIKNSGRIGKILVKNISELPSVTANLHFIDHIIPNNRVLAPSIMIDIEFLSTALPDDITSLTTIISGAVKDSVFTYFNNLSKKFSYLKGTSAFKNILDTNSTEQSNITSTVQSNTTSSDQSNVTPAGGSKAPFLKQLKPNNKTQTTTVHQNPAQTNTVQKQNIPVAPEKIEGLDLEEFLGPEPDSIQGRRGY